ncbi:MAG: ComF family protein [Syntrophotaleaceae bacterium]
MSLLQNFRRELSGLIDLLLPPACPLCGGLLNQGGRQNFCTACMQGIHPVSPPHCPRCLLPYPSQEGSDHLCQSCLLDPPSFAMVNSVGLYEDSLRQAIHRFKYRGVFSLDRPLGILLAAALESLGPDPAPDLLIPVPLHASRLRQRGYNQSLLLARVLGRRWKKPVPTRLLVRKRPTMPQQGLKAADRLRNLKGAFEVRFPIDGQSVLLIDDVMTTGATARECARTLLKAGAREVSVAVLGRARLH